jgi:hypothetical protein
MDLAGSSVFLGKGTSRHKVLNALFLAFSEADATFVRHWMAIRFLGELAFCVC